MRASVLPVLFSLLCFLCVPGKAAAAFCDGDDGWQSFNTTLTVVSQTEVLIIAKAKVKHLALTHSPPCIVASKVTLNAVGISCSDAQGIEHTNSSNAEVVVPRLCSGLVCGQSYYGLGEHWVGWTPNDSEFSMSVSGHFFACPSPQEECEEEGGTWMCDTECDCDFVNCPLIADLYRNGIALTNARRGVDFDLRPDGVSERLGWTSRGVPDDAFLVLDRNGNGRIDNGRELFSNYALRDRRLPANGFSALALFDQVEYGGNRDGSISDADAVFQFLTLWVDLNHDGLSQASELTPLRTSLFAISLVYRESANQDQFGNLFKFFSRMAVRQPRLFSWMYDVFLVD